MVGLPRRAIYCRLLPRVLRKDRAGAANGGTVDSGRVSGRGQDFARGFARIAGTRLVTRSADDAEFGRKPRAGEDACCEARDILVAG